MCVLTEMANELRIQEQVTRITESAVILENSLVGLVKDQISAVNDLMVNAQRGYLAAKRSSNDLEVLRCKASLSNLSIIRSDLELRLKLLTDDSARRYA